MINYSRRNCIQIKVCNSIRSDNHCAFLFVELIHDFLQCVLIAIDIITVQLHSKSTASAVGHGLIPASTYSQIVTFRNYMYAFIVRSEFIDYFCCSVCRMVVNNNDIIFKISFLAQS